MVTIEIHYQENFLLWSDVKNINAPTSSGELSVTMNDDTVVVLRQFGTQALAGAAKDRLETEVATLLEGDGGTEVIIIDDF